MDWRCQCGQVNSQYQGACRKCGRGTLKEADVGIDMGYNKDANDANDAHFVCIENDGVLDPIGLRLMGASTKGDDKIGTFGTGNKYGAAGVVRIVREHGYDGFVLTLGLDRVNVNTVPVLLKGEEHLELTANGQPMGITTQLGKNWEPWMVLREFISNAIDEGGHRVTLETEVIPVEGKTRVWVPAVPEFLDVYNNLTDHFCLGEVTGEVRTPLGRAIPKLEKNKVRIWKKGVLVKVVDQQSEFDYEVTNITLKEDRVADDYRPAVWEFLNQAPVSLKQRVLTGRFEADCWNYGDASDTWKEAFGNKLIIVDRSVGAEDELVVPYQFVTLAEQVGARTLKTDLDARAAERETMPASPTVKDVCKKLAKVGVDVNPKLVLMAKIDTNVLVEKGLTYVNRDLSEAGILEALVVAKCQEGTYACSRAHVANLAALVRRLIK